MRILIWHVHGSWLTSFVQGWHSYLVPVLPGRGPDGRGRARTWTWPDSVVEVTPRQLSDEHIDAVVLQRPHEIDLFHSWTGRHAGRDVPALYVQHDAPRPDPVNSRHPLADRDDIPIVHVTRFNRLMWDCGRARTVVLEHGIPDPGHRYTGTDQAGAVLVNEPVRRGRTVGTDLVVEMSRTLPLDVFGMGMPDLARVAPHLNGRVYDDLPQHEVHERLARHRFYLHPYRWTSLGLSLLEAMTLGVPVLALATTEASRAVPPTAGLVDNDPEALCAQARHWLADPDAAAACGAAGRVHALERYGLGRFLDDVDDLLEGVSTCASP